MDAALFHRFCEIAQDRAGISLEDGKKELVSARVTRRIRALGLRDAREYLRLLDADGSGEELIRLLEVITSGFSRFFREPWQFTELSAAVQRWHASGQRRFRLWSAAASAGEEPYSVGITLLEALDGLEADVRILGTDLSTRMLQSASEGVYDETTLAAVSTDVRRRWFELVGGQRSERLYRVARELRDLVVFKRLNLAEPPFPMRGPLDAVFCRQVMVYFDRPARQRLTSEIERLLKPGGLLFLGPGESLGGLQTRLRPVRPAVYRREEAAPLAVAAPARDA
jgi:chemotaxis protein methyltransferase CheR